MKRRHHRVVRGRRLRSPLSRAQRDLYAILKAANGVAVPVTSREKRSAWALVKQRRAVLVERKTGDTFKLHPSRVERPTWYVEISWKGLNFDRRDRLSKLVPGNWGSGYSFFDGRYDMSWGAYSADAAERIRKKLVKATRGMKVRIRVQTPRKMESAVADWVKRFGRTRRRITKSSRARARKPRTPAAIRDHIIHLRRDLRSFPSDATVIREAIRDLKARLPKGRP